MFTPAALKLYGIVFGILGLFLGGFACGYKWEKAGTESQQVAAVEANITLQKKFDSLGQELGAAYENMKAMSAARVEREKVYVKIPVPVQGKAPRCPVGPDVPGILRRAYKP
jgi:hypothetical protein